MTHHQYYAHQICAQQYYEEEYCDNEYRSEEENVDDTPYNEWERWPWRWPGNNGLLTL